MQLLKAQKILSVTRMEGLILLIRELQKPVIAAVNGAAVGGGFAICLACDVRVASESATFGSVYIKMGLWANLDAPSLRHAMELENRTQVLGVFTDNLKEAFEAFREGREPKWKPL